MGYLAQWWVVVDRVGQHVGPVGGTEGKLAARLVNILILAQEIDRSQRGVNGQEMGRARRGGWVSPFRVLNGTLRLCHDTLSNIMCSCFFSQKM